ncbi:MAG TPA: DUF3108 domain-containing protein [Candidatus Baltobacteraceae bacterium]|nr:DUF3108 domain-containing protein [Candidatus Baltobacteraceae bacterium]
MRMTHYRKSGRLGLAVALLGASALPALPAKPQAPKPVSSHKTAHHGAAKADPPAPMKPVAMPFHAGETLNYRVSWSAFSNAASVQLAVPEQRDLYGYSTWHFRAQAHTTGTVRSLFTIDDQFDSYTDRASLETRQYETHLNELGKIQDQILHLAPAGQLLRVPPPTVVVPAGTLDPLGAMFVLRHVDWDHTPEFRGNLYDAHDVYEMSAKRETPDEKVTVAAGTFSTSRISIDLFQHQKPVPGVHLVAWLANDAPRTPVLLEAQLPIGNIRAELTSASQ